jgi:hypothetical protein
MNRLAHLMAARADGIKPNEALPVRSKEYLQPVLLNPLLDGPPTVPLVFVGNQRLEFGAVLIDELRHPASLGRFATRILVEDSSRALVDVALISILKCRILPQVGFFRHRQG